MRSNPNLAPELQSMLDQRMAQLEGLAKVIEDRSAMDPLLRLMSIDTGLTLKNIWQRDFLSSSKLLRRFQPETGYNQDLLSLVGRKPYGTVACILPGNGALNILTKVLTPAHLLGNRVVFRLPRRLARSAASVQELIETHVPGASVEYSSLQGENSAFLRRCMHDSDIAVVVIFGSDAWITPFLPLAQETGTKIIFEGPGNDPAVVFSDADPQLAAREILKNAFTNGGQSCSAIKRVYVQRDIYEPFLAALRQHVAHFKLGLPFDENVDIGPTQSVNLQKRILRQMENAREKGASFLYGDGSLDEDQIFKPTLIKCTQEMEVVQQETFYSVLPLVVFEHEHQAKAYVDGTKYGLNSCFFGTCTQAFQKFLQLSHKTVCIDSTITDPKNANQAMITGGFKNSGFVLKWVEQEKTPNMSMVPVLKRDFLALSADQMSHHKYLRYQGRVRLIQELSLPA